MKVKDVPQDLKYMGGTVIRDLDYAVDEDGKYQAVLSDGWSPQNDALEVTMDGIDEECQEILERVRRGETSPLEYHAARNVMPLELLARYTGFSKRKVRKHLDPKNFNKLDDETLAAYADALRITVDELKSIPEQ
ncbi:MAG: hypothetical protein IKX39_05065 [Muribaculaceae bacterium]|nr:hypothetical protein [Muribaculaceae bacterium]